MSWISLKTNYMQKDIYRNDIVEAAYGRNFAPNFSFPLTKFGTYLTLSLYFPLQKYVLTQRYIRGESQIIRINFIVFSS